MTDDAARAQAEAAFGAPAGTPHRPSRAGYWIGGALIALGAVVAVAWFVLGMVRFANAVDDLQRVAVPGTRVMALSQGRKAIYYEGPGGEEAVVPSLRIRIVPAAGDDPPLAVGSHSGTVSYSMSGHAGRSMAGFSVPRDGRFRVSVGAPSGAPSGAQLAIGSGLGHRIVGALVGGFVILLVGGVAGTALIVVTSTRRSRAPAA